jgi:hypothetical protein
MLPIEQRPFGDTDAFGELTLREAGGRPDRGNIDTWYLDPVDNRPGSAPLSEGKGFAEALLDPVIGFAHLLAP